MKKIKEQICINNLEITNAELVEVRNQQAVTDSRKVAEVFGKEHKNVIQSIENIKAKNLAVTSMFYETDYTAGTGLNGSYKAIDSKTVDSFIKKLPASDTNTVALLTATDLANELSSKLT